MAKNRKPKFSKRNPDRLTARDIHPVAYHEFHACTSLDDEIDNEMRATGNQPFENPAYYDSIYD